MEQNGIYKSPSTLENNPKFYKRVQVQRKIKINGIKLLKIRWISNILPPGRLQCLQVQPRITKNGKNDLRYREGCMSNISAVSQNFHSVFKFNEDCETKLPELTRRQSNIFSVGPEPLQSL